MSHSATEDYAARRRPVPLFTVNEAAEYLNIERSSLYRLMRQGELSPSARVGKRWRFRIEELDAYAERSRDPAP
jgi:excisionase family DNA binding protein